MTSHYRLVCLLVFMLSSISFYGQQQTVSGKVTDSEGLPLPGVNILIEGTNQGSQTDFDGNYSIDTRVGQSLRFSYLGFETLVLAINADTASTVNVTLKESSAELEEVVVTAQGIKREKKAL